MNYGLEVFDGDQDLIISLSSRLTKILGSFTIPTSNGSIVDARLGSFENRFYIFNTAQQFNLKPTIFFSGNTISWQWIYGWGGVAESPASMGSRTPTPIIYGVY